MSPYGRTLKIVERIFEAALDQSRVSFLKTRFSCYFVCCLSLSDYQCHKVIPLFCDPTIYHCLLEALSSALDEGDEKAQNIVQFCFSCLSSELDEIVCVLLKFLKFEQDMNFLFTSVISESFLREFFKKLFLGEPINCDLKPVFQITSSDFSFGRFMVIFKNALLNQVENEVLEEILSFLEINRFNFFVSKISLLERLGGVGGVQDIIESFFLSETLDTRIQGFVPMENCKQREFLISFSTGLRRVITGQVSCEDFCFAKEKIKGWEIEDKVLNDFVLIFELHLRLCISDQIAVTEVVAKMKEIETVWKSDCLPKLKKFPYDFIDMFILELFKDDRFMSNFSVEEIKKICELLAYLFLNSEVLYSATLKKIFENLNSSIFYFNAYFGIFFKILDFFPQETDFQEILYSHLEIFKIAVSKQLILDKEDLRTSWIELQSPKVSSLYSRLGDEPGITRIVDLFFLKTNYVDCLKSFFEKNKVNSCSIRKKMIRFISGLTGGPTTYIRRDLRSIHYYLNVTNFHFDTVLDVMREVANDLEIGDREADEFIRLLWTVRSEITSGCLTRMEVAHLALSMGGRNRLYEAIGGDAGMNKLIQSFFSIVCRDLRINSFFNSLKSKAYVDRFKFCLTELIGGPRIYKGRDLAEVHKNLGISNYCFDAFVDDIFQALISCGQDMYVDDILIAIEPLRRDILNISETVYVSNVHRGDKYLLNRLGGESASYKLVKNTLLKMRSHVILKHFFPLLHKVDEHAFVTKLAKQAWDLLIDLLQCGFPKIEGHVQVINRRISISEMHFDAFIECFRDVGIIDLNLSKDAISDCIRLFSHLRSDVTSGYVLNRELSRLRVERPGRRRDIYIHFGGFKGLSRVLHRFFADYENIYVFSDDNLKSTREFLHRFLVDLFKNGVYTDEDMWWLKQKIMLSSCHESIKISERVYRFRAFLHDLSYAFRLETVNVLSRDEIEDIEYVLELLEESY